MTTPPKLDPVAAYEAIQRLLAEDEKVGLPTHARERLLERNVTTDDVLNVLRSGVVSSDPTWDERHKNWKYTVKGTDCERVPLGIVIALEPWNCRITLITVLDTTQ
jgi:hypothetical protein